MNVYRRAQTHGNPRSTHVDREINDAEAAVVRRIFELYDSGEGLKRIAMQLNAEQARVPEAVRAEGPDEGAARSRAGHRAPCGPSSCASCIAASSSGTRRASAMTSAK